jgi:hypothetical protein
MANEKTATAPVPCLLLAPGPFILARRRQIQPTP